MKLHVKEIPAEQPEEVLVRCHDKNAPVVASLAAFLRKEYTAVGYAQERAFVLPLTEIFYFEVVDGASFLYCRDKVYRSRQKLYEFEALCSGSMLFRCSKSMILNADKIQSVRPVLSGRIEALLENGEKAIISRQYVARLKQLLGIGGEYT